MADPHENGITGWGELVFEREKKMIKSMPSIVPRCSREQSRAEPNAANNLTLFRCYVNLVQLSRTLMLARIMENGSVGFGCTQRAIILPYVIIWWFNFIEMYSLCCIGARWGFYNTSNSVAGKWDYSWTIDQMQPTSGKYCLEEEEEKKCVEMFGHLYISTYVMCESAFPWRCELW